MDLPILNDSDEDVLFFDALDEFPFHDCPLSFSDQSEPSPENPSPAVTIRRRSATPRISENESRDSSSSMPFSSGKESKDSSLSSSISSEIDSIGGKRGSFTNKKLKIYRNLKENEEKSDLDQGRVIKNNEGSTVTMEDEPSASNSADSTSELDGSSSNLLEFIAGLVIKAIGFQINLFVSFITFPIWVSYNSYMLIFNPFRTLRRGREYLNGKFLKSLDLICELISPLVGEWIKENKAIWNMVLRCGWGLFWSFYVGFILCGLLVSSLMISGFIMRYLVEEPMQMKELLNFDFTKLRPVSYVPIISCVHAGCEIDCEQKINGGKREGFRVIPPKHKVQVTVSLTLPESEYNRNLGIFQVRLDFLSVIGETLASSSHHSMLKFKSEPIRLLSTFLKIAPLVAGYVSESQTLNVKFRGITEGNVPTACLKVTIEQRAEYHPGAGIPEMYDASLILESELPFFKRFLWSWKKTIFVWITITAFIMELLFSLVCCRPIIMPRTRPRGGSIHNGAVQNSHTAQN
ncbi:hypothetical protein UlMin_018701 [Ulmus minor]